MGGELRSEVRLDPEGIPPELRWDLYDYLENSSRIIDLRRPSRLDNPNSTVPMTSVVVVMDCPPYEGAALLKDHITDWRRECFSVRKDISQVMTTTTRDGVPIVHVEPLKGGDYA